MIKMDEDTSKTSQASTTQLSTATSNVEIVRQQRFEVGPRYTDLKFIGEGAYGMPEKQILRLEKSCRSIVYSFRHGCIGIRPCYTTTCGD